MSIQQLYCTLIFLIFFSLSSWGQSIRGLLLTEEAAPIDFSIVSLYQTNGTSSTLIQQLIPSEEGIFSFEQLKEGSYTVMVEGGLGFEVYQSDTLIINTSTTALDLGEITIKYEAIVVEGEKVKPLLERDIDKTTINIAGTSLSTLPSISNILQLAPEVTVVNKKINISGKSNILLLVNGKRTTLKLENIPPNTIEAVEVVSNPSSQYDANVEAVLNVILKKGSWEGIQGTFYAKYTQGIYPRTEVGTNLEANKGSLSANLAINYEYNHTRPITMAKRKFEATTPFYYSTSALSQNNQDHNFYTTLNLNWDFIPKHSLTLTGEYSLFRAPNNTVYQKDSFSSSWGSSSIDSSLFNQTNQQSTADNYQVQLSYNGAFGANWKLASAINYMNFNPFNYSDYSFQFTHSTQPTKNRNFNYQMYDTTKAGILIGQIDASWNKKNNFIDFGVKYTNLNTYYSIVFNNNDLNFTGQDSWFKYNESIYAAYVQWKGSLGNFLQWRLGFRGEYAWTAGNDQQNTNIQVGRFNYFPSAAFLFILSDNHIIKLAYNKSIQRVSFFDRSPYQYYTGLYTKFVGNTSLRPQITHSVQLDYDLFQQFRISLYYNEQIDYINQILEQTGTLETLKNINFQNSNFGLSIASQLQLTEWWQLAFKISGTGIYTRGETQNQPFNTWAAYAGINLMQSFNLWNWMSLDVMASYTSPYSMAIYNTSHLFFVDLNFRKTFLKDQLTLSIYISDLFGTNIERNGIDFTTLQMQAVHNQDVRTVGLSIFYNFSKGREKTIDAINTLDGNTLNRIQKN